MQRVLAERNLGARRNVDTSEIEAGTCSAHQDQQRVLAQNLTDGPVGVLETGNIVQTQVSDRTASEHVVDLGVETLLDLGVLSELVKKPGQRHGGGFGSGSQDRDDLVV